MKFFEAVWARLVANDTPAPVQGSPIAAPGASSPSAQTPPPTSPNAGIKGLAVRCASEMPADVFVDPQRVKWVLLQPEVAACALRFASLTGLGEKRAAEAQEARAALRKLLVAELPSDSPEHIERFLDSMHANARGKRPQAPAPPVALGTRDDGHAGARPAELPQVRGQFASPRSPAHADPVDSLFEAIAARPEPRPSVDSPPVVPVHPEPGSSTPIEYELHVLPGTTTDDLDTELVREYVHGSTRRRPASQMSDLSTLEVMRSLRAIDGPLGMERLTVLGALFFAQKPECLLVQSKVRFVEFPGTEVASSGEKVAYRYSEEFTGTITELIARMERLHKERLAPGVLADGFRLEELPSVPLFALREAMVNAVCHRDYSLVGANIQVRLFEDRLEVQSPGGLPGPVTVENILTESYARNPRIADVLRDLGYVERHGLGIDNMIASMEDAHLPRPEFSNSETSFTVTLRFRPPDESDPESWLAEIGAGAMEPGHQKALVFARRLDRIDAADYRSFSGADEGEAERQLRGLVRDGWLVQNGTKDEAYYTLGPRAGSTTDADRAPASLPESALESLSASQRRILDIVVRQGRAKAGEVLDLSGLKDRRTVQRALAALTERGLLVRHASSRTDPNATYEVNRDFREDATPTDPSS